MDEIDGPPLLDADAWQTERAWLLERIAERDKIHEARFDRADV